MNVKANKLIQELPFVKRAFFMPSSSDESTCIGAAQQVYGIRDAALVGDYLLRPEGNHDRCLAGQGQGLIKGGSTH